MKLKTNARFGLMFGPEASGLSNEDLSFSNFVLKIPTSKKFKSLNRYSIGIEINNPGHEFKYKKYSSKQISSLMKLFKYDPLKLKFSESKSYRNKKSNNTNDLKRIF